MRTSPIPIPRRPPSRVVTRSPSARMPGVWPVDVQKTTK